MVGGWIFPKKSPTPMYKRGLLLIWFSPQGKWGFQLLEGGGGLEKRSMDRTMNQ